MPREIKEILYPGSRYSQKRRLIMKRNKNPLKKEAADFILSFHLVLMKVKSKNMYGSKVKEKRQIESRKMTELL